MYRWGKYARRYINELYSYDVRRALLETDL